MKWPQTEDGQDVAEYALILAVVVVLVVVTVRLLGSSSTDARSRVAFRLRPALRFAFVGDLFFGEQASQV